MTMRPQLASSPAIAVLTSGELAIDMRDPPRRFLRLRPLDAHLDELPRALAVPDHLMREIAEEIVERRLERPEPLVAGIRDLGGARRLAGGEHEQRVGGRRIAVDGDGVEAARTPFPSSACSTDAEIGASVTTKESSVAMSGAIMPAPLAMPLIVTVASPRRTVRVAPFG